MVLNDIIVLPWSWEEESTALTSSTICLEVLKFSFILVFCLFVLPFLFIRFFKKYIVNILLIPWSSLKCVLTLLLEVFVDP